MKETFVHDEWCTTVLDMTDVTSCNCYVRSIKNYFKLGFLLGIMVGIIATLAIYALI